MKTLRIDELNEEEARLVNDRLEVPAVLAIIAQAKRACELEVEVERLTKDNETVRMILGSIRSALDCPDDAPTAEYAFDLRADYENRVAAQDGLTAVRAVLARALVDLVHQSEKGRTIDPSGRPPWLSEALAIAGRVTA